MPHRAGPRPSDWSITADDIDAGRWDYIEKRIRAKLRGKPPGVATCDFNALKSIAESSPDDIWITFHEAKMWWTGLAPKPVKEDSLSKFRRTAVPWNDRAANGRLLAINAISGNLSQIQGFRGTVCRVKYIDILHRTLNGVQSQLAIEIAEQRNCLAKCLTGAIKDLHWKDFEVLVDLVFRAAGLVRISVLGQHAKGYDLELHEPITQDRYVVQVKAKADLADLRQTVKNFPADDFRRVFFVVHSPANDLIASRNLPAHVEIVSPERLSVLAMDAGLAKWLEDKVS